MKNLILSLLFAVLAPLVAAEPIPALGTVEVAFSPKGGGEALVLKAIDSATVSIDVMAYQLTDQKLTDRLLAKIKEGVQVRVLVDHFNAKSVYTKALQVQRAGASVRSVKKFPIFHHKVLIIDDKVLLTGSYNFSGNAAKNNAENVLVNWDNAGLCDLYQIEFERLYTESKDYAYTSPVQKPVVSPAVIVSPAMPNLMTK